MKKVYQERLIKDIIIGDIALRGPQPDTSGYANMKISIAKMGVSTPILVRPLPINVEKEGLTPENLHKYKGPPELVDGQQRIIISTELGLETIPCEVRIMDDDEASQSQMILNDHRVETKPKDRLNAYRKMMARHPDWSQDDLAEAFSIPQGSVSAILSLSKLTPEIMLLVNDNKIAITSAYAIARYVPEAMMNNIIEDAQSMPTVDFVSFAKQAASVYRKEHKIVKVDDIEVPRPITKDEMFAHYQSLKKIFNSSTPEDKQYTVKAAEFNLSATWLRLDEASVKKAKLEKTVSTEKKQLLAAMKKNEASELALTEANKQIEALKSKGITV